MNSVLLMMGGSGTRMGAERPKQYLEIDGKPVFYYIVKKYLAVECVDYLCIVSHKDWIPYVDEMTKDLKEGNESRLIVTNGGNNRSESVRNGLKALEPFSKDNDVVMIHDATHPYVDVQAVEQVIDAVNRYGGATVGARQYDTCYQMNSDLDLEKVVPRESFVSGASPEAFRFGQLSEIYFNSTEEELSKMTSAGAMALAYSIPMKVIPSRVLNLKLTYPEDFELFKILVNTYFFPN